MIDKDRLIKILFGPIGGSFRDYWRAYGGWDALLTSRYLYWALFVTLVICFGRECGGEWEWYKTVLSVIPNILGFSLGGYAMMIGFGDREFLKAMIGNEPDGSPSIYMEVSGAFVHFIVVQASALLWAFLAESLALNGRMAALVGVFLFVYAVLTIVAATFAVLQFAKWYDGSNPD